MAKKDKTELERLSPGQKHKCKDGREIEVLPLRFKQLRAFSASISSLFTVLSRAGVDDITSPDNWPILFDACFDEVTELMAVILEMEVIDVQNLNAQDGLALFAIIVDQNIDDLVKKNINLVKERIQALLPKQPKPSSRPATRGKASNA